MNAALHERARELFESLCDASPGERDRELDQVAQRDPELAAFVRALLAQDREPDPRLARPAMESLAPELIARDPESIGRYRIIGRLGAGGMGVVYEAEQDSPRRRVALKLLRRGLLDVGMLRRFEHEAQVLARLSHPGIAQIFEAGRAQLDGEPRPFFALELVRGEALVDHARRRGLDVRARLQLLARVCDAVEHAHQSGVVHRDLKPSNILVDERGDPKVLDFGVARATGSDLQASTLVTGVGELIGTLAYMSPEQVAADPAKIDARADVYALGVIAYELLAGRRPFDLEPLPLPEAARVILEREPTPLGVLDRDLRGDVETIVAKCLEKSRERRYASARELAADVRRFLADEPIVARPASATYQLAKFARRNRALVGGLVGIFVAVCAGFAISLWMYSRAEDARAAEHGLRQKAEETSATLRETNDFFLGILESPAPQVDGREVRVVDALDRAAERVGAAFADRPKQRAHLLRSLGTTYAGLGQAATAREYLEQSLALADAEFADDPRFGAEIRRTLAVLAAQLGDPTGALVILDRARDDLTRAGITDPCLVATLADQRGRVLLELGRVDDADVESRRALELEQACGHQEDNSIAQLRVHVLLARGEYAQAEQLCREQLERERAGGSVGDSRTLSLTNTLCALLHKQHRDSEAVPWLERVLELRRKLCGEAHPDVATDMSNLATSLGALDEFDRAIPLMRDALERARASVGDVHVDVAITLGNLGVMLDHAGRGEEAIATLRESDAMFVQLLGDSSVQRAFTLMYLGDALRHADQLDAARETLSRSVAMRRELLTPDHPDLGDSLEVLGRVEAKLGDHAAAAEHLGEAYRIWRQIDGEELTPFTLALADALSVELAASGATDEALALARETLAYAEQHRADDAQLLADQRARVAELQAVRER